MTPHVCSRRRRSSPSRTRTSNALAVAGGHAGALIDHDPALVREAVKRAATSQDRRLEAPARKVPGRMPAAHPASAEAAGQLDAAYDFYLQADADRDTARVRAALRALGIRERQGSAARPQHGWASPTRPEQGVVDLVAQGLTSREAASELFLSPDTVNTHLRHPFTKLGIRSRVELARLVLACHQKRWWPRRLEFSRVESSPAPAGTVSRPQGDVERGQNLVICVLSPAPPVRLPAARAPGQRGWSRLSASVWPTASVIDRVAGLRTRRTGRSACAHPRSRHDNQPPVIGNPARSWDRVLRRSGSSVRHCGIRRFGLTVR
jgi:DNA-binding CsgD family transcriptional regulator